MEEIKAPKKERKFLKGLGEIALVLIRELVLGIGKKVINKVGNKRERLVIAIIILASSFAFAQYPATGNKQRLGYQTTGDGLVFRGRSSDTVSLKPSTINNAYHIFDTVNNVLFSYIKTKGGWKFNNSDTLIVNNNFSQPVDSLFFKTSVSPNNVDTAKMRWDYELGTVVLGMYDKVPNEIGFKNFWLVKNQTGSTITKNSLVYASSTVGASGRISVSKFIANGTIDAKYLLGITAHDLSNGEDGYVISFGKIRQVNTDTFAAGAILYPSPTTAGVWTDVEPVAPNIDMPIGFCINSHINNGTISIRVASGYALHELHDVAITSPSANASLYYKSGLWRDTTAALLVSDTASMLTNYLRTGVANSSYLKLTGGTLTGALNGTTGTFTTRLGVGSIEAASVPTLFTSGAGDQEIHFTHNDNTPGRKVSLRLTNNNSGFYTYGGLIYAIQGAGLNVYDRMTLGVNTTEILHLSRLSRVGIMNDNPSYTLDVSGTFNATGNSLIGGTLDVTGATTLSNLAGSGTRMVTASSTGLLSTQTILTPTTRGSNTFTLPDIGAISFLRYNADNTVSQRAADGMRSDLGGTTIGQSMFTLTNPSAITFPRFNADNTVTALDAASFRTAIGAGTGTGTVTSVTGTLPISSSGGTTPNITIANAAVSTTGVVTATTQTFGGAKTFNGVLNASSDLNVTGLSALTGGATIGTMATTSSLTHVIGVNSSNAIGEIGVGDGIKFSAGFLGLDSYRTIALMDFPNTSAQSSSDLTSTVTGAVAGSPVLLGVPNASVVANTSYSAWVSSTNTVTVRFNNYSSSSANPASGSFYLIVLNL